jgi:tetratricopeptide (TPR) repeat protein
LELAEVPHNKAWCHNYLGVALRIMGSLDEALDHHRQAFELLEPLAEVQMEFDFLPAYAQTCRAAGLDDQALALHERTIELARKLGRPLDESVWTKAP